MYQIVQVEFLYAATTQRYTFKAPTALELTEGSMVVVKSANGFGLAYVKEVYANTFENAEIANKATAWVVDKVDLTDYNQRTQEEQRRKWLIKQLNEKKSKMQDVIIYEALAERDIEAKKLLDELKLLPTN